VPEDVEEAFLNHSKDVDLHLIRKPGHSPGNLQIDGNSRTLPETFDIPPQRRNQAGTLEFRRMAQVRQRPHFLQAPLAQLAALVQEFYAGTGYSGVHSLEVLDIDGDRKQVLGCGVMQLPGDAPPFIVLKIHQL
jgi:hypothetical protein